MVVVVVVVASLLCLEVINIHTSLSMIMVVCVYVCDEEDIKIHIVPVEVFEV